MQLHFFCIHRLMERPGKLVFPYRLYNSFQHKLKLIRISTTSAFWFLKWRRWLLIAASTIIMIKVIDLK